MSKTQLLPTTSSHTDNTMEDLLDLPDADDSDPFIRNWLINPNDESAKDAIEKICTDLKTVGNFSTDQNTTSTNTPDDIESSPSTSSPESSEDDDGTESFHPEEWLIQEHLSSKNRSPRLNEFLLLLLNNLRYLSYASWVNKNEGLFKIHKPIQVAYLWKQVKARKTSRLMDYGTFSRGIRYYYKSGTMIKTHTKHTYRFGKSINLSK